MSEAGMNRVVRIGGASGYWGDSAEAARQLVLKGNINYLVFDYLAEVTMSILVRARAKTPEAGYARDFVDLVMKPLLPEIHRRGIRVIANAGGVNIAACAEALAKVADEAGLKLRIATVAGDDLMGRVEELRGEDVRDMTTGKSMPGRLISANAYLGAFPIAAALDSGADIVITGRCVDSATTLGALIHEFGWRPEDHDRLAAGTLAGHILECGAQGTGGNFTDWRDVVAGWPDMGYPIAECESSGGFVITKPEDTGGLVSRLSVSEQIVYELGDPGAYLMPDVTCDFRGVSVTECGRDRVRVEGARGYPPPKSLKVSATWHDGYRASSSTVIAGFDVIEKAEAYSSALLERVNRMLKERGLEALNHVAVHLIGAETLLGAHARPEVRASREVMVRIDVRHAKRDALELFSKEVTGVGLSMTTGRCSGGAGRPKVTPVIAQFAFLVDRGKVQIDVHVDGKQIAFTPAMPHSFFDPSQMHDMRIPVPDGAAAGGEVEVPLIELAVARSGDKGDNANVGVIARHAELLPWLKQALTAERVGQWFAHVQRGGTERYEMPGLLAFNFVLANALDGGGTSSLHLDSQGKTYAQQLLAMPVRIPESMLAHARKIPPKVAVQ
ncbi:acyclic terpene utilization AtuA family protein [Ottowia sp. VDI28]|uniref:acyclic terpene utilization AtuA family protein n=1 Tax=Ottowia sp. VDI28 TaxID=3133968 RepID=UPI003C2C76A8